MSKRELTELTSNVEAILRKRRGQHLDQMIRARLGTRVSEAIVQEATEARDGRRDENLGVLRQIPPLIAGIE